ncbi:MAG: hypothetical protein WCS15_08455 [Prevotella sp.]
MIALLLSGTLLIGNNAILPDLDESEDQTLHKTETIEWKGFSLSLVWNAVVHEEDIMSAVYGPYLRSCHNGVCDTLHVDDYPATENMSPTSYLPLKFNGYTLRNDTLDIDIGYDGMIVSLVKKKGTPFIVSKKCDEHLMLQSTIIGINADSVSGTVKNCDREGKWKYYRKGILVGERNFKKGVQNGTLKLLDGSDDLNNITIIRGLYCNGKRCGRWFYFSVDGDKEYKLYGYPFSYDSKGVLIDSVKNQP